MSWLTSQFIAVESNAKDKQPKRSVWLHCVTRSEKMCLSTHNYTTHKKKKSWVSCGWQTPLAVNNGQWVFKRLFTVKAGEGALKLACASEHTKKRWVVFTLAVGSLWILSRLGCFYPRLGSLFWLSSLGWRLELSEKKKIPQIYPPKNLIMCLSCDIAFHHSCLVHGWILGNCF